MAARANQHAALEPIKKAVYERSHISSRTRRCNVFWLYYFIIPYTLAGKLNLSYLSSQTPTYCQNFDEHSVMSIPISALYQILYELKRINRILMHC